MIIHHTGCLHLGVDDRRPDETEASCFEILTDLFRQRGCRRQIPEVAPRILDRHPLDKRPNIAIKRPELLLHSKKCLGVADGRSDLRPVADNRGVLDKALEINPNDPDALTTRALNLERGMCLSN